MKLAPDLGPNGFQRSPLAGKGQSFIVLSSICDSGEFVIHIGVTECHMLHIPGRVAQSVTCLAADTCLTANPGFGSSIWPGPILCED